MNRNTQEFKNTESQTKFSHNRIQHIEKYWGLFCDTLASITRKNARLRDKNDILSKYLMEYCEAEKANTTTRNSLIRFTENFSAIQDYRQAQINRLDVKVVRPLSGYGAACKQMKAIVKSSLGSHDKELAQQRKLDRLRQKAPGDSHQITRAETDLQVATNDARTYSKTLAVEMEKFEKEKIMDLKKILTNFVKIEMAFHARALEYYSKCAENIATINEDADLEEFGTVLLATGGLTRQNLSGTSTNSEMYNTSGYNGNSTFGTRTFQSGNSTLSDDHEFESQRHDYNRNMYGTLEDDDTEDDDEENRLR